MNLKAQWPPQDSKVIDNPDAQRQRTLNRENTKLRQVYIIDTPFYMIFEI